MNSNYFVNIEEKIHVLCFFNGCNNNRVLPFSFVEYASSIENGVELLRNFTVQVTDYNQTKVDELFLPMQLAVNKFQAIATVYAPPFSSLSCFLASIFLALSSVYLFSLFFHTHTLNPFAPLTFIFVHQQSCRLLQHCRARCCVCHCRHCPTAERQTNADRTRFLVI